MAPKKKAAAGADQEADTTRLPDALPLEYLAAFMATEEANEEVQRSVGSDRTQWAAEAYKRRLPLLLANEDVSKVLGGEWKNKQGVDEERRRLDSSIVCGASGFIGSEDAWCRVGIDEEGRDASLP